MAHFLSSHARTRRLRSHSAFSDLLSDVTLAPSDLVLPLFVRKGRGIRNEVKSMPGVFQLSPDEVVKKLKEARKLGIKACILFGVVGRGEKDDRGSVALDPDNIVCQTIRRIKASGLEMLVITDLCFCEYTSHGHCGILDPHHPHLTVDNDRTLPGLVQQAIHHIEAGADMVAPSGMMDGAVAAIRAGLDQKGFTHLPIMSYAVKFASSFYGPFRDAADSAPTFGNRRGYQMDGRNRWEPLKEARADIRQGADILMVKPGMPYLDVLKDLREKLDIPLAVYQVSGEYAMIKAAGQKGWIDESAIMMESLHAFKRAGASMILTYFACEAAKVLRNQKRS